MRYPSTPTTELGAGRKLQVEVIERFVRDDTSHHGVDLASSTGYGCAAIIAYPEEGLVGD
jgi:hypothetical protein